MALNPETIAANAAKPKKVKTQGVEAEAHPIADQILADQHQSANDAASLNELFGCRVRKARFGRTRTTEEY